MTKADIAKRIHDVVEIPERDAESLLEQILDLLKATLKAGEEINVSGFGRFRLRSKSARVGRNPRTGEEITIPARRVVTFQASALLRHDVNQSSNTEANHTTES